MTVRESLSSVSTIAPAASSTFEMIRSSSRRSQRVIGTPLHKSSVSKWRESFAPCIGVYQLSGNGVTGGTDTQDHFRVCFTYQQKDPRNRQGLRGSSTGRVVPMQKSKYMIELRSAVIAATVAVFVAAPLSTAATDQAQVVVKKITGKQGKRGPRGFTGAQGPQGERGPAGQSAPAPVQPKIAPVALAPHGQVRLMDVCDAGQFATGGSVSGDGVVQWSRVHESGMGYEALVANPSGDTETINVTADCYPINP